MDLEKEIIKDYMLGQSGVVISTKYNIPVHKVYYILKKFKIDCRSNSLNSLKYKFNDRYFDTIDTESKAYWLGFLCADGYVRLDKSGQKLFGVAISVKDREHLEKLREDLDSTHPIYDYKATTSYGNTEYSRLLITSSNAVDSLVSHGCVANKSKILQPPKVSKDLERHWIRGYFDGDGSIKTRPIAKAKFGFSFVGTEQVIRWISEKMGGCVWFCKDKNIWYCDISINFNNLEFLYGDASRYLQSKFDRAVLAKANLSNSFANGNAI